MSVLSTVLSLIDRYLAGVRSQNASFMIAERQAQELRGILNRLNYDTAANLFKEMEKFKIAVIDIKNTDHFVRIVANSHAYYNILKAKGSKLSNAQDLDLMYKTVLPPPVISEDAIKTAVGNTTRIDEDRLDAIIQTLEANKGENERMMRQMKDELEQLLTLQQQPPPAEAISAIRGQQQQPSSLPPPPPGGGRQLSPSSDGGGGAGGGHPSDGGGGACGGHPSDGGGGACGGHPSDGGGCAGGGHPSDRGGGAGGGHSSDERGGAGGGQPSDDCIENVFQDTRDSNPLMIYVI
ncbi:hypothetical protein Pcinc_008568 [Petrolisthes cinctipes]|uniref:Uncharacterized protein n=1 Tax=Petrolisthes cinctipes TaxID=88211 RepID=A0AAE1KWA9_PETCI|nr:hypothetical protein Pcinc_008568 [Petrolisthes cinctipes]